MSTWWGNGPAFEKPRVEFFLSPQSRDTTKYATQTADGSHGDLKKGVTEDRADLATVSDDSTDRYRQTGSKFMIYSWKCPVVDLGLSVDRRACMMMPMSRGRLISFTIYSQEKRKWAV